MATVPSPTTRAAVVAYADRLHRSLAPAHRVISPLAAWIVLALAAPATSGSDRAEVEAALGTDAASASAAAGDLLAAAPPAVVAAAAIWASPPAGLGLGGWSPHLPAAVATGPVPTQAVADAWTRERTLGLIDRFPLTLTPDTLLVLCSALATQVRWQTAFEVGAPFGDWPVPTLTSVAGPGGRGAVAATRIGDVAVWAATSDDGLTVTSVAADPAVPAADVLAVAHELAGAADVPGRVSLFDLPLGASDRWEITEGVGPTPRGERVSARLPAWQARSELDLLADHRTGFAAVGRSLAGPSGGAGVDAVQVALARFGREGFEAAAVTAVGVRSAGFRPEPGVERRAELRFAHPYAVVATVDPPGPWSALPVFAAWVTEAAAPSAVVTGRTG